MIDSKLERIKKLIRLSTSSNSNEADLALAKARALAAEEGIDLAIAAIQMDTPQVKEEFVNTSKGAGNRKSVTQRFVSWIIGAHFNVKIIYSGNRAYGMKIIFIGRKSDVEMAEYVNAFLNEEFMRRWHYFQRVNNLPCKERSSYIYGLYQGLNDKLTEARKKAENDRFDFLAVSQDKTFSNNVRNQYALMIRNEEYELQQMVDKLFPELRKNYSRTRLTGSASSLDTGISHGRTININRPIGGNKALM